MPKSVSFDIDHLKLDRGVYLSQVLTIPEHGGCIVTLDVRVCKPYADDVLSVEECHTLEHIFATAVRQWFEENPVGYPVYVGPMGCQTGFYVVFWYESAEVEEIKRVAGEMIPSSIGICVGLGIPAKSKKECGNCLTLSEGARVTGLTKLSRMWMDTRTIKDYPQ